MKKTLFLSIALTTTLNVAAMEGKYKEQQKESQITFLITFENKTNETISLTTPAGAILITIEPGETKQFYKIFKKLLTKDSAVTYTFTDKNNSTVGIFSLETTMSTLTAYLEVNGELLEKQISFDPDPTLGFEVHIKFAGDNLSKSTVEIDTGKETDISEEEEEN